jgi:hypothetical protein
MIGIHNQKQSSMTIVVEHAHGGTAKPYKGQIEVFLNRNLRTDDRGGIGEYLDSNMDLFFSFKTKLDSGT